MFHPEEKVTLRDPLIPYTRQLQLLNIFLRDQMSVARYKLIRDGWYKETNNLKSQCISVRGQSTGNLAVLTGYKGTMQATENETVCFQVDTCSRLIWEDTLYEQMKKIKQTTRSLDEFKQKVEAKFIGKFFLLSYSRRSKKIASFDWNQTEDSMLGHDNPITYKNYFKNKYGVSSDQPEICVVKAPGGDAYLPQHMNLTVVSDECADIYDKAMDITNMPIHQRLQTLDKFVSELNQARHKATSSGESAGDKAKREMRLGFNIAPKGRVVQAIALTVPKITFKTRGGLRDFQANEVKREWRNTSGYVGETRAIRDWTVIYDKRHYQGNNIESEFMNTFTHYCRKRNFNLRSGDPWAPPKFKDVEFSDHGSYRRYLNPKDTFVLILIPDGILGSEIKVRFTRAVDFGNIEPSSNLQPTSVQFAKVENISTATKMFGVWENMAVKAGNVLYRCDPMLPKGSPINMEKTWVFGLDIAHNGLSKPSVAVLSTSMDPMEGSLRNVFEDWKMLPPRLDILSFYTMWELMDAALERGFERIGKDPNRLPEALWVFRDGVSEGQLLEMVSKEYNGIKRAVREFNIKHNLKKKLKWKPAVEFIVVQKNVHARFAEKLPNGRIATPRSEAVVIHNYVTSARVWDFIGWFNTSGKNRPMRYVVVKDELELAKRAPVDLFQLCYAMCYTYSYGIPFPFGNPNQPSPIKIAKHFAENVSQGILPGDQSEVDFEGCVASERPRVCTVSHTPTPEPGLTRFPTVPGTKLDVDTKITE